MKKRILSFGVVATHDLVTAMGNLNDALSISDYDAFVYDPVALQPQGVSPENYSRRQAEIRDLIAQKGGVAICLLRPKSFVSVPASLPQVADTYGLFDLVATANAMARIRGALRAGWGSRVQAVTSARGPSVGYLRVLDKSLCFAAYLETPHSNLEDIGATIFAVDSVSHPVAIELVIGAGRICFVPVPNNADGERVGSAIVRIVEAHFGGLGDIEAPAWASGVEIPGASADDGRIATLETQRNQIDAEISSLQRRRAELLNFRLLLYGYGKPVLEPVVRSALRTLGFDVPESDDYKGDWDVELHEPRSSATAIGEIEGSTGAIDIDKYRQLLDYIETEFREGRDHRGILIGNGYRLTAPEAPERQKQFTEHVLRGAERNEFCLLPTTELFKAVCTVLETAEDHGLKIRIRDSILSTVGVWTFAREVPAPAGGKP
jgi:hypothetical protein